MLKSDKRKLSVTFYQRPSCLFCVSKGVVSAAECGGVQGGGKWGADTDRFERVQKIQGRERARVTVSWISTDFTVWWSVVSSCSIGVQNQNQGQENEYVFFNVCAKNNVVLLSCLDCNSEVCISSWMFLNLLFTHHSSPAPSPWRESRRWVFAAPEELIQLSSG